MKLAHSFTWICDNQALADLCALCARREAVFIDTEFVRRTTFFAKVGLIQIATGEDYYLVDPLAIDAWQPLQALMTDPNVVKVMHSCSEDVDVFHNLLGVAPSPLFDTQIACSLAGLDYGMGFAKMVAHFCDIELDKGETTSDWLARPLTDSQCQYAVADVVWLIPCYRQLMALLQALGRQAWVLEDSAQLVASHVCTQAPDTLYKRMKGIGRLKPQQLAICRSVCAWRDTTARELDRPKNRLISDAEIIAIAKRPPYDSHDFERNGFGFGWIKRYGKPVLEALRQGQNIGAANYPQQTDYEHEYRPIYKAMKAEVGAVAGRMQLAENALAGKKELLNLLESMLTQQTLSPEMQGWRKPIIGETLAHIVRDMQCRN